jgi:hypothetical protein
MATSLQDDLHGVARELRELHLQRLPFSPHSLRCLRAEPGPDSRRQPSTEHDQRAPAGRARLPLGWHILKSAHVVRRRAFQD